MNVMRFKLAPKQEIVAFLLTTTVIMGPIVRARSVTQCEHPWLAKRRESEKNVQFATLVLLGCFVPPGQGPRDHELRRCRDLKVRGQRTTWKGQEETLGRYAGGESRGEGHLQ